MNALYILTTLWRHLATGLARFRCARRMASASCCRSIGLIDKHHDAGDNDRPGQVFPIELRDCDRLVLSMQMQNTQSALMLCLLWWSFHPHAACVWKVAARGGVLSGTRPSAMDTFNDALMRAKCVRASLEHRGDVRCSKVTFRSELFFLQGSWVVNFQPFVAAAIYEWFAGSAGAVVFDSSAGWGGRMLGAVLARNVCAHIACEPSTKTFLGLRQMQEMLRPHSLDIQLHQAGSEDFALEPNSVDFAFTSPPYFLLELYADEGSQAHIKYPTYPQWRQGFLKPTIRNNLRALKPGGNLLINIANNKMFLDIGIDLESDTCDIARELGAVQQDTVRMLKPDGPIDRWEPIFVFRRV